MLGAKPRVFFSQSMRADVGRPRGGHLDQIVLAQPVNGWGVSGRGTRQLGPFPTFAL
jgi:hypothetical protein